MRIPGPVEDSPTQGEAALLERAHGALPDTATMAGHVFATPDRTVPARPSIATPRRIAASAWPALARLSRDEADFGTPFLFHPVAMGLGAALWFAATIEPSVPLIALAAVTALGLALQAQGQAAKTALMLAFFCAFGALSAAWQTERAATVMMGSKVTTRIVATLVRAEPATGNRTRLWLDIRDTNQPKLKFPPERVKVTARGDHALKPPGSTVAGLVRLFALSGPLQPGGYDFAFEAYFDGVGATGFFLGEPVFTAPQAAPDWTQRIASWRAMLTARIADAAGSANGAIVAALVTGVRGALSEADNEALRRSGLAHVMSISGLHLALVCGAVLASIRLGLAFFPVFTSRHAVRKWGAAAAIVIAIGYCVLSGGEVATVRSTIMIVVMLAAVLLDRPAITMRNLAIAALIILAWTPHEVLGPGFQMSFAATAALIAVYRVWSPGGRGVEPPRRSLARRAFNVVAGAIAATVISSTAAGLATLPFGAFHFERVAPWGTLANLFAFPFISLIVMPALLVGVFLMPIGLDAPLWRAAEWGVARMMDVARLVAGWPGPDATGAVAPMAILLCTIAMLVLLLPATRLRWAAVPPFCFAALMWIASPGPVGMVSEDAALVGLATAKGMAVNSAKPDRFLTDNWSRVFQTDALLKPIQSPDGAAGAGGPFRGDPVAAGPFACGDNACVATLANGSVIAHVQSAEAEAAICGKADLIIEAAVFETVPCPNHHAVITAGMLARHGTAALHLANDAPPDRRGNSRTERKAPPTHANGLRITWTHQHLERPWQAHRRYSRAARDIPETPPDPSRWRAFNPRLKIAR
jgi:competence protein ComEC